MKELEKLLEDLNEEKIKYHVDVHGKMYKQKGPKGEMIHVKEKEEKK
jgi:hypothetical protein